MGFSRFLQRHNSVLQAALPHLVCKVSVELGEPAAFEDTEGTLVVVELVEPVAFDHETHPILVEL